jgi:hypothetical protein
MLHVAFCAGAGAAVADTHSTSAKRRAMFAAAVHVGAKRSLSDPLIVFNSLVTHRPPSSSKRGVAVWDGSVGQSAVPLVTSPGHLVTGRKRAAGSVPI